MTFTQEVRGFCVGVWAKACYPRRQWHSLVFCVSERNGDSSFKGRENYTTGLLLSKSGHPKQSELRCIHLDYNSSLRGSSCFWNCKIKTTEIFLGLSCAELFLNSVAEPAYNFCVEHWRRKYPGCHHVALHCLSPGHAYRVFICWESGKIAPLKPYLEA